MHITVQLYMYVLFFLPLYTARHTSNPTITSSTRRNNRTGSPIARPSTTAEPMSLERNKNIQWSMSKLCDHNIICTSPWWRCFPCGRWTYSSSSSSSSSERGFIGSGFPSSHLSSGTDVVDRWNRVSRQRWPCKKEGTEKHSKNFSKAYMRLLGQAQGDFLLSYTKNLHSHFVINNRIL